MKSFCHFLFAILGMSALLSCTKEVEPSYIGKYVDLGLSVKWAQVNLGATNREDFGDYFAWGEITPKKEYDEENYRWFDEKGMLTKYCSNGTLGRVDDKLVLEPEDDAATVALGSGWRIPTYDEYEELVENCTWTFSTLGGVRGYMVTSNVPGYTDNYIFFPTGGLHRYDEPPVTNFQGLYWSSTDNTDACTYSNILFITISNSMTASMDRWAGLNIRPVYDK